MTAGFMDELSSAGRAKNRARLTSTGRDRLDVLLCLRGDDPVESFDSYGADDLTSPPVEPFDADDFVSSTCGLFR